MDGQLILEIILGFATVVVGIVGARYSARSAVAAAKINAEAEQENVEALAYQRARETYSELLDDVRTSANEAQANSERANARAAAAERRASQADERATRAERRIARLERLGGLHMIWDQEAQAEVQRLGGHLRKPPVLDDLAS